MAGQFDGTDAGIAGAQVFDNTDVDGTFALVSGAGEPLVYAQPGRTRTAMKPGTYIPVDPDTATAGAKLVVTGEGTSARLTFTQADGTVTVFAHTGNSTSNGRVWVAVSVAEPALPDATTYTRDGQDRITRILAPAPDGVDCATLGKGCRALDITYATTTTGTDRAGQVKSISYTAWNPAKAGGAGMATTVVATYEYDAGGRLATATDPRTGLSTRYGYSGTSTSGMPLLTSVTPSGLAGYTLAYGAGSQDDKSLLTVTRGPAVAGGASTRLARFVYGINPATTTNGLPAVTAELVGTWGQDTSSGALPTYGAAVFGPDRPNVAGSSPSDVSAADWQYAGIQYATTNGWVVNAAEYGAGAWQFSSAGYDRSGNPIRAMDTRAVAQVRDLAQTAPVSQTVADSYASITRYNTAVTATSPITWKDTSGADHTIAAGTVLTPAGSYVTDTWAPATEIPGSDGAPQVVRTHTHTDYDQGAPNNGIHPASGMPFDLATAVTTTQAAAEQGSSDPAVPVATGEPVTSQTLSGYNPINGALVTGETSGWVLGMPTTTTTVMGSGQAGIVTASRYDGEGRTVEVRSPGSNGTDAATTLTGYYTAAAQAAPFTACGGRPEWAGLACQTRTAEPVPSLPVSTTSNYTYYLQPQTHTEVNGSVTRTLATTYDAAGRAITSRTTVAGLAGSTPVPATTNIYDPDTGLQTATASVDSDGTEQGRVSTSYDLWGRAVTYTDSGGVVTTTTYNSAGQVAAVEDPVHTSTYTYNTANDHRGLLTKLTVSGVGDFTATYDGPGAMTSQTLLGRITQHLDLDRIGNLASLTYTGQGADGDNTSLLAWSMVHDIDGRVVGQSSTTPDRGGYDLSRIQSFAYDRADRLTTVTDATGATPTQGQVSDPAIEANDQDAPAPVPSCTVRTYGFDPRGNRTSLQTVAKTASQDATCADTLSTTSKTWAYDTADRVQHGANTTGTYVYDALGRQTSLPATDTPNPAGGNASLAYYDTDDARSITHADTSTIYTLDPAGRRLASTTTTTGETTSTENIVRTYTGTSDSPGYVTATTNGGTPVRTWYGASIAGDLATTITGNTTDLALIDPQGSVATSITVNTGDPGGDPVQIGAVGAYDEYGTTLEAPATTGPLTYGWLGAGQRATDTSGLLLMGARLYNPTTGLFTSTDPIPGGNTTAYTYPQDPINNADPSGNFALRHFLHRIGHAISHAAHHIVRAIHHVVHRITHTIRETPRIIGHAIHHEAHYYGHVIHRWAHHWGHTIHHWAHNVGHWIHQAAHNTGHWFAHTVPNWVHKHRRGLEQFTFNFLVGMAAGSVATALCATGVGCIVAASISIDMIVSIPGSLAIDKMFHHQTTRRDAIKYVNHAVTGPIKKPGRHWLKQKVFHRE